MPIKEDYICPKCKQKNRIKIYTKVTEGDIKKIIDKSIFKHECKKCHEIISVEYPLTVEGEKYTIYFTPGQNNSIDECPSNINRVCDTYADLKEKILILEANLNDIVIEALKSQIKNKLPELKISDLDNLERLRYNSFDPSYISFSLVGIDKLVGISVNEYYALEDNLKIKKIKKSVLIDEYTYKNYIRGGSYEINGKKRIHFFKW